MSLFYEEKERAAVKERVRLDFPLHLHRALEMLWLQEGESLLLVDGKEVPLRSGDLAMIFPDRIHGYRDSRGIRGILFILPLTVLSPFREALTREVPLSPVLHPGEWEGDGLPDLMRLALADSEKQEEAVMTGLYRAIVGKALRLMPRKEEKGGEGDAVRDALRLIHRDLSANLSRRDLARAVGVSESTLSHQFSRTLHTTLPRYVSRRRLEEARRLLEETDLTVTQAALRAGFGSLRSFNRAWREQYGASPTKSVSARRYTSS